jgi:hypothetical protein
MMSKLENAFRTAMVGGFDRQDVLSYLERMSREHKRAEEAHRKTLESLEEECRTLRGEVGVLRETPQRDTQAEAELDARKAELDAERESLDTARAALDAERRMIEQDRAEFKRAQASLGEDLLRLDVDRRQLHEDRAALDARKSELGAVEQEAQANAAQILEELTQRLQNAERQYNAYADGVESAAAAALRELEAVRGRVLAVPSLLQTLPFPALSRMDALAEIDTDGSGPEPGPVAPPEIIPVPVPAPPVAHAPSVSFLAPESPVSPAFLAPEPPPPPPRQGINWAEMVQPDEEDEEERAAAPSFREYDFFASDARSHGDAP